MLPLSFARLEFKVYGSEFKVYKGQPFLIWLYIATVDIKYKLINSQPYLLDTTPRLHAHAVLKHHE